MRWPASRRAAMGRSAERRMTAGPKAVGPTSMPPTSSLVHTTSMRACSDASNRPRREWCATRRRPRGARPRAFSRPGEGAARRGESACRRQGRGEGVDQGERHAERRDRGRPRPLRGPCRTQAPRRVRGLSRCRDPRRGGTRHRRRGLDRWVHAGAARTGGGSRRRSRRRARPARRTGQERPARHRSRGRQRPRRRERDAARRLTVRTRRQRSVVHLTDAGPAPHGLSARRRR